MKKLPLSKQNFEKIVKNGFVYVDKTQQIYQLIEKGDQYFLSRPRRFGKSLTVSTLSYLFSGQKELFKGLYIYEQTDYQWDTFPILDFTFASLGYKTTDLEVSLIGELDTHAQKVNISLSQPSLGKRFRELIEKLFIKAQKPVVILIDEYDKPIIDFLTNIPQAKINLGILKDFFSVLKEVERKKQIHFLFITGVAKFSKVSLFSDLNNLVDLTIDPLSNDLVGITEKELHHYFTPYVEQVAKKFNAPTEILLKHIKLWYDGYTYDGQTHLYNPVSLFTFFHKQRFDNFWFETGTPTFLMEQIHNRGINPKTLEERKVENTSFDKLVLNEDLDMVNLMFQTGYLTIKSVTIDKKSFRPTYTLGYPNIEVHESFMQYLLKTFTRKTTTVVGEALLKIKNALKEGDLPLFIQQLQILLADISYAMHPSQNRRGKQSAQKNFEMWEGYFHTIIYLITSFIGLEVETEVMKHKGRLDLVAQTDDYLYLMEFKLAGKANKAIAQIKEKQYALSYKNSPKTTFLVGISFDKEERNIKNWEAETWT